ncbi:Ig-like domain-containing protein, partial [Euryarchaeota archaeon]|nr:Ig-like domain-containing protein [Euryarchaeota archaeon]
MPLQIDARPSENNVTLRDLRRVAFGLSAAILIVMVAGAISDDSGSDSVSVELDNLAAKSYVNIGVTTAAGDNVVTAAEASSGFTVTGTSNGADGGTVTAHYGSVSTTCVAANPGGTWSCDFDNDGAGDANSDGTNNADMSGVNDGTITIYATVTVGGTAYTSSNFFVTQDTSIPTMTITSTTTGVTSGSTTNDATIALKFTSGESTTDFVAGDITLSAGTISNFAGSGSIYTATFTPSGDATYTISVGQGSYNDANSNPNAASNNFQWAYDGTPPTMTITTTTAGVTSGSTTKDATIAYVFTSNEPTTNFVETDISFSGGSLSDFTGVSTTVYTATFTPSGDGATSVAVGAGQFTDSGGTGNTVSNTFAWTYDGTAPTMTITAAVSGSSLNTGSTTNDATITLTFTSTEDMTGFVVGDIDISSGSLSALSGSGDTYTSTFTPSGDVTHTIDIDAGQFTDAVGNQNTASNAYTWTYDGTNPTMTITSSGSANGGASNAAVTLTFTSSEATSNFAHGDITVSGGTLGSLGTTSSTVYTALFTPSAEGSMTIDVAGDGFTDAVGNGNTAATQFAYTHDTTAPAMVITTTSGITTGDTSNDATIAYVFTAGQATTNFDSSDIDVTGGTITAFAADGGSTTVYLATFTPSGQGATSVAVAAGAFTDAAGNANTVSNTFAWTFDSVGPTMTITSSGSANGGASNAAVTLTFTSNEPTANFDVTDILVTNGALSSFAAGSTTVYTATFTPTGEGAVTIDVASPKFTDASG